MSQWHRSKSTQVLKMPAAGLGREHRGKALAMQTWGSEWSSVSQHSYKTQLSGGPSKEFWSRLARQTSRNGKLDSVRALSQCTRWEQLNDMRSFQPSNLGLWTHLHTCTHLCPHTQKHAHAAYAHQHIYSSPPPTHMYANIYMPSIQESGKKVKPSLKLQNSDSPRSGRGFPW